MKKNIFRIIFVFLLLVLLVIGCSMNEELRETIKIGGSKEVQINLNPANIAESSEKITDNNNKNIEKKIQLLTNEKIQVSSDFSNFEVFISNANAGIIRKYNNNLWFYLEETRKFYDAGWYFFNNADNTVTKAIRTYFDINLLPDLSPKYNKKEYYYFKKKDFDKIQLFRFDQEIFTWLTNTFNNELADTNINCIAIDEHKHEIWFGLKNRVIRFDMRRELWSDPFRERNLQTLFNNSDVNEIVITADFVWFILFDCSLVGYDKKNDSWQSWKPSEFSCSYLSFITEDDLFVLFKSDVGIKKFNKLTKRWSDFDEANHLSSKIIKNVVFDDYGDFWIETLDEIARYRLKNNRWEILKKSSFPARNRLGENYLDSINSLAVDGDNVWITTAAGLLFYTFEKNGWIIYDKKDINDRFRIDLTYLNAVYSDARYIWLGSDDGLLRIKK